MAISDSDVWRTAKFMMDLHGADAASIATHLANDRLAQRDEDGQTIWNRVVAAIGELQRRTPNEDDVLR
jgi:hypothetical protein